jgi:hypothetical protein
MMSFLLAKENIGAHLELHAIQAWMIFHRRKKETEHAVGLEHCMNTIDETTLGEIHYSFGKCQDPECQSCYGQCDATRHDSRHSVARRIRLGVDLLDANPHAIPPREDDYDGTFWTFRHETDKKGERVSISESTATITERIQLASAAPFSMLRTPCAQDAEVEPTPVRYILDDGKYYRSLSGADALPAKTLLVRLRYIGTDGELQDGSKTWLTRVGLYVLHEQMRKRTWKVIEMIPVSYEHSQPTEAEGVEFCCQMLYGNTVAATADVIEPQRRRIARKFKTCPCGKRFLAKRANQEFHNAACGKRLRRLKPVPVGVEPVNIVCGPLIPQELDRPILQF